MTTEPSSLLFSFYGDDFTGSTDAMEALTSSGVPTALFLEAPEPDAVRSFRLMCPPPGTDGRLAAFGVPGISRTMSPAQMRKELPPIFEKIAATASRFFHYKVCSTFDSAPDVGNLGVATDLAMAAFPSDFVPLLVGAPALGRYCVFGNLFARVGHQTIRLDRHPTMARHPVTPMKESDLRLHLSHLTERPVRLFDLHALSGSAEDRLQRLRNLHVESGEYVLFDVLEERHLLAVGELVLETAQQQNQLLVGSSGVEYALCGAMAETGALTPVSEYLPVGPAERFIILAGSASPVTAAQIEHGLSIGFAGHRLDTVALCNPVRREQEIQKAVEAARNALREGRYPMLYAARGPDDPAIAATRRETDPAVLDGQSIGAVLAQAQGEILRRVLSELDRIRVVVAGGDTSGFAARALGIRALEMACPIAPGAPLCRAHASQPRFHGLEICLKGGQNGNSRYFESILCGEPL